MLGKAWPPLPAPPQEKSGYTLFITKSKRKKKKDLESEKEIIPRVASASGVYSNISPERLWQGSAGTKDTHSLWSKESR